MLLPSRDIRASADARVPALPASVPPLPVLLLLLLLLPLLLVVVDADSGGRTRPGLALLLWCMAAAAVARGGVKYLHALDCSSWGAAVTCAD